MAANCIFKKTTKMWCRYHANNTLIHFTDHYGVLFLYIILYSGFSWLFSLEMIFKVQRNHVTPVNPTFCCQFLGWALCWRNGKGPVQGGANDQKFFMCLYEDDTGGKFKHLHALSKKGPCF